MVSQDRSAKAPGKRSTLRTVSWSLGGLILLVLVGFGVLMMTFMPARLDLPVVDVGALPAAAPPAEMSISTLGTGSYESPAALTFRGGSWSDKRHLAATAVLIRHPKGLLLVDTGFGRNVDRHVQLIPSLQRTPMTEGRPAIDQLAAAGIRPADIAAIIPTHSHWDHISGVDDLKAVPLLETVEAKRWIDSKAKGTEVLNSFAGVRYEEYKFDQGPYLGFPRSHDVWGDGSVVIVPAPGHTPDSVIVFVALPSGSRYALIGDTVFQSEGIDIPAEKPWMLRTLIGEKNDEIRRDIALLRQARERYPQIRIIPAHDLSAFRAIPQFPATAH